MNDFVDNAVRDAVIATLLQQPENKVSHHGQQIHCFKPERVQVPDLISLLCLAMLRLQE